MYKFLIIVATFAQVHGFEWISADRLPPPVHEQILFFDASDDLIVADRIDFYADRARWQINKKAPKITHWAELPPKPEID